MRRRLTSASALSTLALVVVVLLVPGPVARAGTVTLSFDCGKYHFDMCAGYRALPGEANRVVLASTGYWNVLEDAGAPVSVERRSPPGPNAPRCQSLSSPGLPGAAACPARFASVLLDDGNDVLSAERFGGIYVSGGSGDDIIRGSEAIDQLRGDTGADVLIGLGGPDLLVGNTELLGADRPNTINAGAGNDILVPGTRNDRLSCGSGQDLLTLGPDVLVPADCERVLLEWPINQQRTEPSVTFSHGAVRGVRFVLREYAPGPFCRVTLTLGQPGGRAYGHTTLRHEGALSVSLNREGQAAAERHGVAELRDSGSCITAHSWRIRL